MDLRVHTHPPPLDPIIKKTEQFHQFILDLLLNTLPILFQMNPNYVVIKTRAVRQLLQIAVSTGPNFLELLSTQICLA